MQPSASSALPPPTPGYETADGGGGGGGGGLGEDATERMLGPYREHSLASFEEAVLAANEVSEDDMQKLEAQFTAKADLDRKIRMMEVTTICGRRKEEEEEALAALKRAKEEKKRQADAEFAERKAEKAAEQKRQAEEENRKARFRERTSVFESRSWSGSGKPSLPSPVDGRGSLFSDPGSMI